jgi:8-oxo-dGTP pyrophosphatase MutT (NUDIX family)
MNPVAACVVLIRDGAVLAVSRRDDPAKYGFPGGKMEPYEAPEVAAARELFEETGIRAQESELRHLYTGIEPGSGSCVATYWLPDNGQPIVQSPEGVVVWVGWPALLSGPFAVYNTIIRQHLDDLPERWVSRFGSGTAKRAIEEGMAWRELYLIERAAFEFGYGFQIAHLSRLTVGRALAEGDSRATTETCWWARALRWRAERDKRHAKVSVVHARLDDGGEVTEGIAILYEPTVRPSWLPQERVLIAFTSKGDQTVNPC